MIKEISLYLHIPFCERKCHYCDFLSGPAPDETREAYVEALCREIRREGERYGHRAVDTVFIGGGTPSILAAAQLEQLMEAMREAFVIRPEAEISMEANPGSADERKLRAWQQAGVNRLSIGLQSADDGELQRLGRIHTREDFLRTWEAARTVGFTNLNIDIMSALPGQNMASYERTLEEVLRLKPEHISAYSLIIEEGTLFYKWFGPEGVYTDSRQKEMLLPDEEEDRLMYELTGAMLGAGATNATKFPITACRDGNAVTTSDTGPEKGIWDWGLELHPIWIISGLPGKGSCPFTWKKQLRVRIPASNTRCCPRMRRWKSSCF